jgi:hypothetical protein
LLRGRLRSTDSDYVINTIAVVDRRPHRIAGTLKYNDPANGCIGALRRFNSCKDARPVCYDPTNDAKQSRLDIVQIGQQISEITSVPTLIEEIQLVG